MTCRYIKIYIEGEKIVLIRKTRNSGTSIVVTIPSQLIEAYDINKGDRLEIIPISKNEIKIKKCKR